MHYKNGREAKEGDPVVYADYNKKVLVGQVHSLNVGATSCNCQIAVVIPGGVMQTCETLDHLYHAEDALLAIDPLALEPKKV
ncbi:MAG: hypothetical protein NTX01_07860 [Candidatus Omnitrophica bacterium]|nr:hypothetical protein [Candidatus Omnitrophota bacterium]